MTFSLSWSGKHNDFSPENVHHSGSGGDLEDRVVIAFKHAIATVLHSMGPDEDPRDVNVSLSGHVPQGTDPAGTSASLSLQVMAQVPQDPPLADPGPTEPPQPSPTSDPSGALGTTPEGGTDSGGEAGAADTPIDQPADPVNPPASAEADPAASSSPDSTPASTASEDQV